MSTLLDVEGMFNEAADSGLDPSIFATKINVPRARSVIEWVEGEQFRNVGWWARQAEQAVRLFADYCPSCSDLNYLDAVPVGDSMVEFKKRIIILEEGVCPKCAGNRKTLFNAWWQAEGKSHYPDFANYEYMPPYELVGCLGQRASKSTMAGGFFATYVTHRYLCLPDPISYYGVVPGAPFQVAFVATVVENALQNLWPHYRDTVRDSPWFRRYTQEVRKEEKRLGLKTETLFKIRDTRISIPIKNLFATCLAADEKALRGATRILGACDELAYMSMEADAKKTNANTTYNALQNSLETARNASDEKWLGGDYDPIPGLMLNISSPAHKYDKIMSLLEDSKKSPRVIGFHFATWEINPKFKRESMRDREVRDPVGFMKDFGAIPPLAQDTYIDNVKAVEATQHTFPEPLRIETVYSEIAGTKHVAGAISRVTPDRTIPRIICLDAGHTNNAFAFGMYHVGLEHGEYVVYTDTLFSAIPETIGTEHVRVNFIVMADRVIEVCKQFDVRHVLYDRWQSVGEIQRLRAAGIDALAYSPVWADFEATKNLIYSGKFRAHTWEKPVETFNPEDVIDMRQHPYTHFGYQMATVQAKGRKVTKPAKGDDDMFRTAVLAVSKFRLNYAEYAKTSSTTSMGQSANQSRSIGVMIGRSGSRSGLQLGMGSANPSGILGTARRRRG